MTDLQRGTQGQGGSSGVTGGVPQEILTRGCGADLLHEDLEDVPMCLQRCQNLLGHTTSDPTRATLAPSRREDLSSPYPAYHLDI